MKELEKILEAIESKDKSPRAQLIRLAALIKLAGVIMFLIAVFSLGLVILTWLIKNLF